MDRLRDRIPPAVQEGIVLLPNMLKLTWRLVRDPDVPLRNRMLAAAALGYVASPIDLLPDVIPVLGLTDDLVVVAFALRHLMAGAGDEVVKRHWDGSEEALDVVHDILKWGAGLVPWRLRKFAGMLGGTPG